MGIPFILTLGITGFAPLIEGGTTHLPALILQSLVIILFISSVRGVPAAGAPTLSGTPLAYASAAILLVAVFSLAVAPYREMALTWLQSTVFYALYYFLAVRTMSGDRRPKIAVLSVIGMGALETCWGAWQYFAGKPAVKGSFFNPNMVAGYVAVSLVLAVSLLVGRGGRRDRAYAVPLAITAAFMSALIILSGSRGGVLAAVAGLSVVLWRRFRGYALVAAAVLVALVLVVPNPVRDKAFSADTLAYSRVQIWKSAVDRGIDHPLGLGLGNFKYYSDAYKFPVDELIRYGKTARTAHNEYLHFGAETGLPGIAAMAFALAMIFTTLSRAVMRSTGGAMEPLAAGIAGGVVAVLAHSLVDSNLHEPGIVFMLLLLLATAAGLGYAGEGHVEDVRAPARVAALGGILALVLSLWAAAPYAAWQYNEKAVRELTSGRFEDALASSGTAVMFAPGNAVYHEQRASILYAVASRTGSKDRLNESFAELDEAARLNPVNYKYPELKASLITGIASAMKPGKARTNAMRDALAELDRAGELAPYNADIMYRRAVLLVELGRASDAEAVLIRLKSLEPDCLKGRLLLAQVFKLDGRTGLSADESYSIIRRYDELKDRRMRPDEKSFVSFDMVAARALAGEGGGDVGKTR